MNISKLVLSFLLFASTILAQLDISVYTDKDNYEYGEIIKLSCKITNHADTTFEFLAGSYSSCQAEFSFNNFNSLEHTACLATAELLTFEPHSSKIYKWIIDPKVSGLPNKEGKQQIIGTYYFNLADTIYIEAPQFLGGQLNIGYDEINSEAIKLIKDSLEVAIIDSNKYEDRISETWQILGHQIDSLINKYSQDTLFRYCEKATFIQYESIVDESPLDFYPLKIGNKWYYEIKYDPVWITDIYYYDFTLEVVKDTILANNKKYFKIKETRSDTNEIKFTYERIDSSNARVYSYSKGINENEEFVLLDLQNKQNVFFHTYIDYFNYLEKDSLYLKECFDSEIFETEGIQTTKSYETNNSGVSPYCRMQVSQNIGITYTHKGMLDAYDEYVTLKAAFLNGKLYGDSTLVNIEEKNVTILNKLHLSQNYPNPFNPTTNIKYSIQQNVKRRTSNVKLMVYDILGKVIATLVNQKQKAASYEVVFDASNLSSGIYYYQLKTEDFVQTKKMILLK